ncbi:hypothetical protein BKA66DRAFT_573287 [Pyrenochaeta sp. MPI-SDFR-AT-0127]|nr:hypothetical protein BKA66DRAFT_573287 [Pyrenochaeta sp. MPI-SDFR-AT-0127]
MAEAVGLAASIIQIAGAGAKLSIALYNFTDSAARADQDIRHIADDVELTANALENVGKVFETEEAKSIVSKKAIQHANNIIKKCEDVFNEISDMIEKRRKIGKDGKKSLSMMGKLAWPMKEQRVELNRRRLESLKNSLVLLLNVLQLAQGQARGKMEKGVMEEEREKIRELHQRQQDSLKSLQALESKLCQVALDDEETLQGSTATSRVPTLELMFKPQPTTMPPLEKAGSKDSLKTITIDFSAGSDSEASETDATTTDDEDERLSVEELAKCAKHVQKLLRRITLLQKGFESNQKTTQHRKKRVHKMYQRFCRNFETEIITAPIPPPVSKTPGIIQRSSEPRSNGTVQPLDPPEPYFDFSVIGSPMSNRPAPKQDVGSQSPLENYGTDGYPSKKIKPFSCRICHKNFHRQGDCKRHEALHFESENLSASALLSKAAIDFNDPSQLNAGNMPSHINLSYPWSSLEFLGQDSSFGIDHSKHESPNQMVSHIDTNTVALSSPSNFHAQEQAQAQAHARLAQQRQQQAAQARNQQDQLFQGQIGGLNLPPGSQHSPAMSALTRPMAPIIPQQQLHLASTTTTTQQPEQAYQNMSALMREGQQRAAAFSQVNQSLADQVRMEMMPADLDPSVKAQLLKVPDQQFRAILRNYLLNVRRNNGIQNNIVPGSQPTMGQSGMLLKEQQPMPQGLPIQPPQLNNDFGLVPPLQVTPNQDPMRTSQQQQHQHQQQNAQRIQQHNMRERKLRRTSLQFETVECGDGDNKISREVDEGIETTAPVDQQIGNVAPKSHDDCLHEKNPGGFCATCGIDMCEEMVFMNEDDLNVKQDIEVVLSTLPGNSATLEHPVARRIQEALEKLKAPSHVRQVIAQQPLKKQVEIVQQILRNKSLSQSQQGQTPGLPPQQSPGQSQSLSMGMQFQPQLHQTNHPNLAMNQQLQLQVLRQQQQTQQLQQNAQVQAQSQAQAQAQSPSPSQAMQHVQYQAQTFKQGTSFSRHDNSNLLGSQQNPAMSTVGRPMSTPAPSAPPISLQHPMTPQTVQERTTQAVDYDRTLLLQAVQAAEKQIAQNGVPEGQNIMSYKRDIAQRLYQQLRKNKDAQANPPPDSENVMPSFNRTVEASSHDISPGMLSHSRQPGMRTSTPQQRSQTQRVSYRGRDYGIKNEHNTGQLAPAKLGVIEANMTMTPAPTLPTPATDTQGDTGTENFDFDSFQPGKSADARPLPSALSFGEAVKPPKNSALQDYETQLMLLEMQNKKRLLLSRQELDATSAPQQQGGETGASSSSETMSGRRPQAQQSSLPAPTMRKAGGRAIPARKKATGGVTGVEMRIHDRNESDDDNEFFIYPPQMGHASPVACSDDPAAQSTGPSQSPTPNRTHSSSNASYIQPWVHPTTCSQSPDEPSHTKTSAHPPPETKSSDIISVSNSVKRGRMSEDGSEKEEHEEGMPSSSKRQKIGDDKDSPLSQPEGSDEGGGVDIVDVLLDEWTVPTS